MTNTMKTLIEQLSNVPEDEQDKVAMPLLKALQEMRKKSSRPLAEMIGAGAGLYESPADADATISSQRDEWEY